jgi:SAM-dependent methyltransferase
MTENLYDTIGHTYTTTRRSDPRIAESIHRALSGATTIVNVGAGAGAYEPANRDVVAVEPSRHMIRQRPPGAAPVVRAVAEALPFVSRTFDVALAALTMHHWTHWRQGIAEMKRVASRVVVFAFDVSALDEFWLTKTYFPGIIDLDRRRSPSIAEIAVELGDCSIEHVLVPHDCADGFLAAFWRRPEKYLDPGVRASMSGFAQSDQRSIDHGVHRLETDLKSGAWEHHFGALRSLDALDAGYRLLATRHHGAPEHPAR